MTPYLLRWKGLASGASSTFAHVGFYSVWLNLKEYDLGVKQQQSVQPLSAVFKPLSLMDISR
jgi:hypothetical protein